MPEASTLGYDIANPAPHGGRVGMAMLFGGLLAAPMAWSLQLMADYGLASHACFPSPMRPEAVVGWDWIWPLLIGINIAALIVSTVSIFVSYRNLQRTGQEASGGFHRLVHAGEGRTRFLAVWGIWSGVWFLIAIAFNTIGVFWVHQCGS